MLVTRRVNPATVTAAVALALAIAACCAAPADAAGAVDLIVRRDPGLTAAQRADVRGDAGVEHVRDLRLADTEVVAVPADRADVALADLRADPDVRFAVRDGVVSAAAGSADPYFTLLWGLRNTGQDVLGTSGTPGADMDVPEAWQTATGGGVTVGVVDSGVNAAHEDLAGRIATNPGETGSGKESNGVDDDGDGKVDDANGWDFVDGDNTPQDGDGHGTHVSGTIAAANGNGTGVTGVAPDATVYPLRALDDTGQGSWSALADAFDLAGDMGLRVVNASLGGEADLDDLLQPIFDAHPGTLYVVAAGNNGQDLDGGGLFTPCQVPSANVVCVGASDQNDERASFSNYGGTSADLFAPGVSIVSTYNDGGYVAMDGTSMATPHVAGEAALLLSADPSLTTAQVRDALLDGTDSRPGLTGFARRGRANARRALALVADGDLDGVADASDNCPSVANGGQADADHDGAGDACDPTPRGADADGDGVADIDDACPAVPGTVAAGGCPAPAAGPAPVAATPVGSTPVSAAPASPSPVTAVPVSAAPAAVSAAATAPPPATLPAMKVRTLGRRVTLRHAAVRGVALTVRIERRVCRARRCSWRAVFSASGRAGRAIALTRTLAPGTYRATVAAAGRRPRATTFTVGR